MARGKRFYAVRRGHKPGIYRSWDECRIQVERYPNAEFKGFMSAADAGEYLKGGGGTPVAPRLVESAAENPTARLVALPTPFRQSVSSRHVVIYADGACTGNPGPGGYGVVVLHGSCRKELSAGFRLTTNNRMEILGCIAGLQELKESCEVTIYSDSSYVVNAITKSWALRWRKQGWKRKDKDGEWKDAMNADLWIQMLDLCERHNVRFEWVRGHSGNEGNERCDQLARAAAASGRQIDSAYELPRR